MLLSTSELRLSGKGPVLFLLRPTFTQTPFSIWLGQDSAIYGLSLVYISLQCELMATTMYELACDNHFKHGSELKIMPVDSINEKEEIHSTMGPTAS